MVSSVSGSGSGNVYAVIGRLESSTAEFGLTNKNSAQERITALRNVQLDAEPSAYTVAQQREATNTPFGLTHKNTVQDRLSSIRSLQQRLVENHGFEAKKSTRDALAHNTKIVNIPPAQRGTIADLSV